MKNNLMGCGKGTQKEEETKQILNKNNTRIYEEDSK
jgi:hypothetical protein